MGIYNKIVDSVWSKLLSEFGFKLPDAKFNPWMDRAEITEPTTIYVETTGSDSGDGSQDRPFKTVQAAIDYLKQFVIKAQVTIQVGAGTFDGFVVEGFRVENLDATSSTLAGVEIVGTRIAPTLTTGTASGTSTSTSKAGTAYQTTITDTTQNWVENELQGARVVVGSVSVPVVSNTATSFTYLSVAAAPPSATSYSFTVPATTILSNAKMVRTTNSSSTTYTACIVVNISDSSDYPSGMAVTVSSFSLSTTTTANAIYISKGVCLIRYCKIEGVGVSHGALVLGRNCPIYLYQNYLKSNRTSSGILIQASETDYGLCNGNVCKGVISGATGTTALLLQSTPNSFSVSNSYFESCELAVSCTGSASVLTSVFKGCTSCITTSGRRGYVIITSAEGSGNTNFILANKNAAVQATSTTTTPGATNEIVLDGTNYTLVELRAATPKLLTNTYGTIVYE